MWTPHEIRKLIAQLSGIALGIGGFYLLVKGVQATGRINISSNVLSGELESGSAGLFLLFLSFLLIALPTLWGTRPTVSASVKAGKNEQIATQSPQKRLGIVTGAAIVLSLVLLFGGEYLGTTQGLATGQLIFMAGLLSGLVSIALLFFVVGSWIDPDVPKQQNANEDPPKK